MEKKCDTVSIPSPPPSVGSFDDSRSTYSVDQPPPAYQKMETSSVKVTKIIAGTVLLITLIAGITAVAIVYMQHNLKCSHLMESKLELPQSSKLIQEKSNRLSNKQQSTKEKSKVAKSNATSIDSQDEQKKMIFPIHIDLDDVTAKLMDKNSRARLNCVIEKKRPEDISSRSQKAVPLSNQTSGSKLTHITGETMSLTCRSGSNSRESDEDILQPPSPRPFLIQIPIEKENNPAPPMPSGMHIFKAKLPLPNFNRINPILSFVRQVFQSQPPQKQLFPLQLSPSHISIRGPLGSLLSPKPETTILPAQNPNPIFNFLQKLDEPQSKPDEPQPNPAQIQEIENPFQRLLNPFQQIRIPFLPFPQLNLHQMIPQLLEVHKQIQMQREKGEQDNGKDEPNDNKMKQRQEDDDSKEDIHPVGIHPMARDPNPMMMHEIRGPFFPQQGQSGPPHMMQPTPMHRMMNINTDPNNNGRSQIMSSPHPRMDMMPHHNGPINLMHPPMDRRPGPGPNLMMRDFPNMDQHNGEKPEIEKERMDMNLFGAPSFHNNHHVVNPGEMMYREGPPFPFPEKTHNVQPRSPEFHSRMKRSAD